MVSPSRLQASSVTKKMASTPSTGKPFKQPAVSNANDSNHRSDTAAVILPNSDATTIEASRDGPGLSIPAARVLPEQALSSETNNHDDSDLAYSSFSATQGLADVSNNSDSALSSVKATNSKVAPLRRNAKAPTKTIGKRLRADSNTSSPSSNGAAVMPIKKRVRSNALTRSAPRATSTTTPGGLAGNAGFMQVASFLLPTLHVDAKLNNRNRNFTATIFIIQLGPDGPQFHAHESALKRSPKLAEEIEKAKANKRVTKQNTLPLMPHDAIAFEQMLQFLYKDKFPLSQSKGTPSERLGEFKELMSLAKHYVLPDLQKQIVKLFSSSKILSKIPPGRFFDWAEDMYYEELDHASGPFKLYLSRVAPTLMKGVDEGTMKELIRMVSQGGGFAEQLFIAAATALNTQTHLTTVKKEEQVERSTPVRPNLTKGKEQEPVRQTAREEAPDTHEDESMDDIGSLFVRK